MTIPIPRTALLGCALMLAGMSAGAHAQIGAVQRLPYDTPQTMRNLQAVCTGVGSEARNDLRWASYPLHVETVGKEGQYLGAAQITLNQNGEALVSVVCGGPWTLFQVPPGSYDVTAEINDSQTSGRVDVGGTGQARLILRFSDLGGTVSPEYVPQR